MGSGGDLAFTPPPPPGGINWPPVGKPGWDIPATNRRRHDINVELGIEAPIDPATVPPGTPGWDLPERTWDDFLALANWHPDLESMIAGREAARNAANTTASTPPQAITAAPISELTSSESSAVAGPPTAQPAPPTSTPIADREAATAIERQQLRYIQLDVLGKIGKKVKVFSSYFRRSETIDDPKRLDYPHFLQLAGPLAKRHVLRPGSEPVQGTPSWSVESYRDAIALVSSFREIRDETELGVGCWSGANEDGSESDSVVIVNSGEAAEIFPNGQINRITHPVCRGHLLDLDAGGKPWYEIGELSTLLQQATNLEWRLKVFHELIDLFGRWKWQCGKSSPIVMAGLVLATWVQSLWEWRPMVALIGASKSGKSTLCIVLAHLFGELCKTTSDATAAAIRQVVKTSSRIIIYDEFDAEDKNQKVEQFKILKMLRNAGRGAHSWRGASSQEATISTLKQIVWLAGIQMSSSREADRNRNILLELITPPDAEKGKLITPPPADLRSLGQKTLAIAIWAIGRARMFAVDLKGERIPGIDDRVIESYGVPAAMLAVLFDDGQKSGQEILRDGREVLKEMLTDYSRTAPETQSDHAQVMHEILSSPIQIGADRPSAAQLLQKTLKMDAGWEKAAEALEARGIKLDHFGTGSDTPRHLRDLPCLLIAYNVVGEHLIKNSKWGSAAIDQILSRVPEAVRTRRRIGGHRQPAIAISREILESEFLSDDEILSSRIIPDGGNSDF